MSAIGGSVLPGKGGEHESTKIVPLGGKPLLPRGGRPSFDSSGLFRRHAKGYRIREARDKTMQRSLSCAKHAEGADRNGTGELMRDPAMGGGRRGSSIRGEPFCTSVTSRYAADEQRGRRLGPAHPGDMRVIRIGSQSDQAIIDTVYARCRIRGSWHHYCLVSVRHISPVDRRFTVNVGRSIAGAGNEHAARAVIEAIQQAARREYVL